MKIKPKSDKFRKQVEQFSKKGKRFFTKHQYGVLFSILTFVTVMVAANEYMLRNNAQFLAEFDAVKPIMAGENVQYAKPAPKTEERSLAGKNARSPRR